MGAKVGTGTTIAFGTTGFTALVRSINGADLSRPAINTSHLGTTNAHTYIPGDLYDPGGVEFEVLFDPENLFDDKIYSTALEEIVITFPDASTLTADGYVSNFAFSNPLEEVVTATFKVEFTGEIAWG